MGPHSVTGVRQVTTDAADPCTAQLAGIQGWDVYELYSELDLNGQSYARADLEGKRVEARGIKVGVGGQLVRPTRPTPARSTTIPTATSTATASATT